MDKLEFNPERRCYGRAAEASALRDVYERVCASSCGITEVVLVHGCAGTGKTELALTLKDTVVNNGGYFITGKFHQNTQSVPYSAVNAAFTEFCNLVMNAGPDGVQRVKEAITLAVGSEGKMLTDVIPALEQIIGEQARIQRRASGIDTQANRFNFVFRMFVGAISSHDHPVVLFLDDLQWADESSLSLLVSLAAEMDNAHVLFLLAFREGERTRSSPLEESLQELKTKNITLTWIEVSNLDWDTVNDLISDALGSSQQRTRSLTDLVFSKTHGNTFFVIQYVKSLCDDGLLYFSDTKSQWQWSAKRINAAGISDNVVDLLLGKMQRLPRRSQDVLKIAASVGVDVDESTVRHVLSGPVDPHGDDNRAERATSSGEDVAQILVRAVCEGFLIVQPRRGKYRFAHDKIQQAAYYLIPEQDRESFHLHIGRVLWKRSADQELETCLFTVVGQLNRGANLIEDQAEKVAVARLNIRAGKKAMLSSAFAPAALYLRAGIELLGEDPWKKHYDLSYDLFNAAAEAEYCNASFESMDRCLGEVLNNARSFNDKLPALSVRINALGVQGKLQEAMDVGFSVLRQLGETFPSRVRKRHVLKDLLKTKWMLRGKSNASLLCLPPMCNAEKVAAMQNLNLLSFYTYLGRPEVTPLVVFRMVQLSLRYGVCTVSSYGFATYGVILCGVLGDMENGYRFGQLAVSLLAKFDAKEWVARIYASVYGLIDPWKRNIHLSLEPLQYARRVGLETGDIEFSMMNSYLFCVNSFHCGKPLPELEQEARASCQHMTHYKQGTSLLMMIRFWQAVLNFMGRSANPVVLTGEAMNQDEVLKDAIDNGNQTVVCGMYNIRLTLGCFFGEYELAAEMAAKSSDMERVAIGRFDNCTHDFYAGLTALVLAQKGGGRNWRAIAQKKLKRMKKLARHAVQNCLHKVSLLEAEFAVLKRDHLRALKCYQHSVDLAGKSGFTHEQALACERAGTYCLGAGDRSAASEWIKEAHLLYGKWGAQAKVAQLDKKFSSLIGDQSVVMSQGENAPQG